MKKTTEYCDLIETCQPLDTLRCLVTASPSKNCPYFFKVIKDKGQFNNKYERDKRKGLNSIVDIIDLSKIKHGDKK